MSVNSRPRLNRRQQKDKVKAALSTPLREGDVWYPIAMPWWQAWCQYVGFDSQDDESADQDLFARPGEIDNSSIIGDLRGELRPGLVENQDYVLLPEHTYLDLEAQYLDPNPNPSLQGDTQPPPRFARYVIKQGSSMLTVEMYPIKFSVYECGSEGYAKPQPTTFMFISRYRLASRARNDIISAMHAEVGRCRFWVRLTSSQGLDESKETLTAEESNRDQPENEDEGWIALEIEENGIQRMSELFPHATAVDILVELKRGNGFPRDPILNRWKYNLAVGDLIDAQDSDDKWYESIVVQTDLAKKQALIHFKGWGSKFDAWISLSSPSIQKLHTRTTKWRDALQPGDKVEYKEIVNDKPQWYEATVKKIDVDSRQVTVQPNGRAAMSLPAESVTVSLDGEDICQIYTHIKKPQTQSVTTAERNSSSSSYSVLYRSHTQGTPPTAGAVGLSNLGNTCFMNSMLQCLSNTQVLTELFISDAYVSEINRDNLLGTKGKLAIAYANLLKDMWSGKYTVVGPSEFKRTIGDFAPQFAGYQQQDSQELMSYLLDGLHEDLNRVRTKPYVEMVESRGRPDALVCREAWRRFLLRNNSVLVDHCYGLLKSHVTCTACGYQSITFDPFLSLSLPIPVRNTRRVNVILCPLPYGTRPIELQLEVEFHANIADLKAAVLRLCKDTHLTSRFPLDQNHDTVEQAIPNGHMPTNTTGTYSNGGVASSSSIPIPGESEGIFLQVCLAMRYNNRLHRTCADSASVTESVKYADMIYVYQLEHPSPANPAPSYQRSTPVPASPYQHVDVMIGRRKKAMYGMDLISLPHRISYSNTTSCAQVHEIVWAIFQRYLDHEAEGRYSLEAPPYDLQVSSSLGSPSAALPKDSTLLVSCLRSPDALTIVITEATQDVLDNDELQRVDKHPSTFATPASAPSIDLDQCFNKFVEREQLGAQEQWYCSSCKQHLAPIKKFDLWATPDILIIHLKRFLYVPGAYFVHREKINEHIQFPIRNLDLTQFVQGPISSSAPPIYDLYAVSEHSGGLGGGHYTAAAMNFRNQTWYSFNDSSVYETVPEKHITPQAYVLFYKRREGTAKWAGLEPLEESLDHANPNSDP